MNKHYWAGWETNWQNREIILNLLEFADHSLVRLDLTRNGSREMQRGEDARKGLEKCWPKMEEDEDDEIVSIVKPSIGSLRGFQVLKYIRDKYKAFIEEDLRGRTVHRLVDLLPASVVNVALALPLLCPKQSHRLAVARLFAWWVL